MANIPTLFQDSNLSGLPAANPGSGKPWLDSSGVIVVGAFSGFSATWGSITGTLSSQTDLQTAFDGKQVKDATLTALAAVTTAADTVIYATGSDAFTTTSMTSFARTLIDDADAATARTTLGLGTMATQASTSYLALTGGTLNGALSGTSGTFSTSIAAGSSASAAAYAITSVGNLAILKKSDSTSLAFHGLASSWFGSGTDSNYAFACYKPSTYFLTNNEYINGAGSSTLTLNPSDVTITKKLISAAVSSTSTLRSQSDFTGSWVSSTDASRKAQVVESVYDTAAHAVARSFADGTNGYKAIKVVATAPANADMANGEVVFYDNGSGSLAIKLKDSGGTVRTGTVTLA